MQEAELLAWARDLGLPGLVLVLLFLAWRYPPQRGERAPWVFRLEIAVSKDTLVQLFALWRRYVDGKRPPRREPDEEDSADADTPEVRDRRVLR